MPHDPALVADTRAWLTKALMDLLAAERLLQVVPPLLGGEPSPPAPLPHYGRGVASEASRGEGYFTHKVYEAILSRLPEEVRP